MRTKGAKDKKPRTRRTLGPNKLVPRTFKVDKDQWNQFIAMYGKKASAILRHFIEECIKNGK